MGLFVKEDGAPYGPGSTVHPSIWQKNCCTDIKHPVISILFSVVIFLLHVHGLSCFVLEMRSKILQRELKETSLELTCSQFLRGSRFPLVTAAGIYVGKIVTFQHRNKDF